LRSGTADVQLVGPDPRALVLAINAAVDRRRKKPPRGWYLTLRIGDDGEPRRVII